MLETFIKGTVSQESANERKEKEGREREGERERKRE